MSELSEKIELLCKDETAPGSSLYNLQAEMFEISMALVPDDYDHNELFDWVKKLGQDILEAIAVIKEKDKQQAALVTRQSELEGIVRELVEPQVGSWMSAALGDPNVCDVMKADIIAWFNTLTRARKMLGGQTND